MTSQRRGYDHSTLSRPRSTAVHCRQFHYSQLRASSAFSLSASLCPFLTTYLFPSLGAVQRALQTLRSVFLISLLLIESETSFQSRILYQKSFEDYLEILYEFVGSVRENLKTNLKSDCGCISNRIYIKRTKF